MLLIFHARLCDTKPFQIINQTLHRLDRQCHRLRYKPRPGSVLLLWADPLTKCSRDGDALQQTHEWNHSQAFAEALGEATPSTEKL